MSARGALLVLEGLDGSGKSTQAVRLRRRLESLGHDVLHVREPGSTEVGERVRAILLDPEVGEMAPIAEVFLYQAARAQLCHEVIRPALASGRVVVCERWHYATSAYQGVAGGAGLDAVHVTSRLATAGIEADRAVLLDLPEGVAAARRGAFLDRIEQRGRVYRMKVTATLRETFRKDPTRCRIIVAEGSPDAVETRVWEAVRDAVP